jgi:hypothetical protein
MKDVDFNKVLTSMIPLVLAAMWWVISSVNDLDKEIQGVKGNMMMLIDPNGQIIPSPDNALARQQLREGIVEYIHDLQVRVKLLEEHQRKP